MLRGKTKQKIRIAKELIRCEGYCFNNPNILCIECPIKNKASHMCKTSIEANKVKIAKAYVKKYEEGK